MYYNQFLILADSLFIFFKIFVFKLIPEIKLTDKQVALKKKIVLLLILGVFAIYTNWFAALPNLPGFH